MNDVLVVTEAAVRGLSISRLRLLIFLLQGHVVPKPGNLKYSERAVRILAAGKQPFYAAQWEAVQALAQNAKFDLQLLAPSRRLLITRSAPRLPHGVPNLCPPRPPPHLTRGRPTVTKIGSQWRGRRLTLKVGRPPSLRA